jgi:membrane-associated protease RseP (regulator of RpoE activity)
VRRAVMNITIPFGALALSLLLSGSAVSAPGDDPAQEVVVTTTGSSQGWLGVSVQDMSAKQAKKMKVKAEEGAVVTEVHKKSPAEKAGIHEDDIIVEFNGRKIDDVEDLQKAVRKTEPGKEATVVVLRKDQRKSLKAVIAKPPRSTMPYGFSGIGPSIARHFAFFSPRSGIYGLRLYELNPQLGEYFGAPNGRGVLVTEVEKESEGDTAGFRAGDVIIHLGRETVEDLRDISEGLEGFKEGEKAAVEILRKGEKKSLSLTVQEDESLGWIPEGHFVAPHPPRVPDLKIQLRKIQPELMYLEELRHLEEGKARQLEAVQEALRENGQRMQEKAKELQEKLKRELSVMTLKSL